MLNNGISEFDNYYQDVQKRIDENQQEPNTQLSHDHKIDITIVVDMLLTGFDAKYLSTLYVDKNLKYHGLIQAFSRTNRVLNGTKPFGNILDFRRQETAVDEAITLFSGEGTLNPSTIWLVDKAPEAIEKLSNLYQQLDRFMQSHDLPCTPSQVVNLRGNAARIQFSNLYKEVKRQLGRLECYTDLTDNQKQEVGNIIPLEHQHGFTVAYLDIARRLKSQQNNPQGEPADDMPPADISDDGNPVPIQGGDSVVPDIHEPLDPELALFSSALVDYDYIMGLIADYSTVTPEQREVSREQLLQKIQADAKFINDRALLESYIDTLPLNQPLDEQAVCKGFEEFKREKITEQLIKIAEKHGLDSQSFQKFIDRIEQNMVFDGVDLRELLTPLGLGWKARTEKELALMADLIPLLHGLVQDREIAGLRAYE